MMQVRITMVAIWLTAMLGIVGCSGGGDDGGGENPDGLTASNLSGTYDLDVVNSAFQDLDDSSIDILSAVFQVTGNSVTLTLIGTLTGTLTIVGDTITFTETDGDVEALQATFTNTGNTLTLISDDGDVFVFARQSGGDQTNDLTVANLQGTYELDVANSSFGDDNEITSAGLEVDGDTLAFTVTAVSTGTFTVTRNMITITHDDGGIDELQATLAKNGTVLTVIEEDGDTLIYHRR